MTTVTQPRSIRSGGTVRRTCPDCGQSMAGSDPTRLSLIELPGPRGIFPSDLDRIADDGGHRFLVIEEKRRGECWSTGQHSLLRSLAALPLVTVMIVEGDAASLTISHLLPSGEERFVRSGDASTYREAFMRWFSRPRPVGVDALDVLDKLTGLPFGAPAGYDPSLWLDLDRALTALASARAMGASEVLS